MCLIRLSMFLCIFKSVVKWRPSFLRIAVGGEGEAKQNHKHRKVKQSGYDAKMHFSWWNLLELICKKIFLNMSLVLLFHRFHFSYGPLCCVSIILCKSLGIKVNRIAQLVITRKSVTASGFWTVLKLNY